MSRLASNLIVLVACWLVVLCAGGYVTYVWQPGELERVEKAAQVAEMKHAEITTLLAQEATTQEEAENVMRRWHARYKIVPATLSSPEVVGYMNDLTRTGFENFDILLEGVNTGSNISHYSYRIMGRGYFTSLYRFIWEIENNRAFYRLRDVKLSHIDLLTTEEENGREQLKVMVSFDMSLEAFFGGMEGLSAGESVLTGLTAADGTPIVRAEELPAVPAHVLPTRRPAVDPFFPNILQQLPPNTHGLVDVEEARLVSVVGDRAVFQEGETFRSLAVGDAVYLGRVASVDPVLGRVLVRLNKGGIMDEVELTIGAPEPYRQAAGATRLSPLN